MGSRSQCFWSLLGTKNQNINIQHAPAAPILINMSLEVWNTKSLECTLKYRSTGLSLLITDDLAFKQHFEVAAGQMELIGTTLYTVR